MDEALRDLVRLRSGNRCEYCRVRQEHVPLTKLQVEHRNRADYDLAGDVSRRTALSAVETATAIFQIIGALTPDDREAAIEIIKTYERDVLRETTWRARPR